MCLACLEYIKGNLKLNEYKGALREAALYGDKEHAEEIQTIIYDHQGDENSLKEKLKKK